ncbi:hypothetical protein H7U28_15115, partial [Coprobacillus cateniformis]|nr:hypothetical protein [Coprobacillus cateniformis]
MKIITKILIKTLKHDKHVDVREYLQEKLDNDKLTEKQVRYLIKNMNTNIYMLQNVYPVAEAMEKGISIDVIEECASLLDDALDLSIFALENGKGQLYNKVPYDLEHLLALSSVFYYSSFKKFEDSVTMGKLFNEIQRITQCFHQSRELKTISSELFWELVENSVYDIQRINNYNTTVIEYLSEDNQKHVFTIDELFSMGMNLFEIESFKYNNLEYLLERLENVKKIMSNDCHIESVEFKKDDKYILKVIKTCQPTYENINGQIEEVLKEVPSCLFYNPTCEEDYILDT